MYLSSRAIYWSFGTGVLYCFIYIYLMSAFAETIAWICVAMAQLGFIGLTVGCWFYRDAEIQKYESFKDTWDKEQREDSEKNQKLALAGVILFAILSLAFCTCIVCGFKSLKLAIDVIDASADFLAGTKRIILVPVLYFFVTLIIVLVWSGSFMCVASMNTIHPDTKVIP